MVILKTIQYLTKKPEEFIRITDDVHKIVEESGVMDGLCTVITSHTTTGIIVNEGLPCILKDIASSLSSIAPLEAPYMHARFLPSYGATSNNAPGHIKSMYAGNNCTFPVSEGEILCGGAQDIFLAEFDGPQMRKIYVQVLGE
jgi:secondary thiamine-phosphate synthase enzyme